MAAKKLMETLAALIRNIESRIKKVIIPLFSEFAEPHLVYCVPLWRLSFKERQRQNRS